MKSIYEPATIRKCRCGCKQWMVRTDCNISFFRTWGDAMRFVYGPSEVTC